ncbi:MAG: Rrf2 family transcriptional regulator [Leptospirales bacterium]|nr:Rrf2 family transcriptional regulator [Leptospirales bacterium]
MRITSRGRYGLKAMMELAAGGLLKTREISERQKIPQKYLEQIIHSLRKNNLVSSVRGADGGYRLARNPTEITVLEILSALEGDLSIIDRGDSTWDESTGNFWKELDEKIASMLQIPLSDFMESGSRKGELMYYI